MRFIDIKLKCGWQGCPVVAPEGEGLVITRVLTIDGGKPREIDICKEHSDHLDEILQPLLEDGRVGEPKKRAPKKTVAAPPTDVSADDLACKVPDCGRGPFRNGAGLAQHVTQKHDYANLDAYRVDYPIKT